jgi:predicted nucleic acid-binding protein
VIVIDCSAAVEALRGDQHAREVLGEQRLSAPHLIDAEVAQTVRGMVRGGLLTAGHGRGMVGQWGRIGLTRFAMHPLLQRVWDLRANLTAYDAMYVALAEELRCRLVTADARMATAPGLKCDVSVLAR